MKSKKIIIFLSLISAIIYLLFLYNSVSKKSFIPQINPLQQVTQEPTVQPATQSVISSEPTASQIIDSSCKDGGSIRNNVKPCSVNLACEPFTPMSERYCRMPDGSCRFFCTDK